MLSEVQESNRINIVASNSDASHLIVHSEMSSEAQDIEPFDDEPFDNEPFQDIEMEGMMEPGITKGNENETAGVDALKGVSVWSERTASGGASEGVIITTRYCAKMQ